MEPAGLRLRLFRLDAALEPARDDFLLLFPDREFFRERGHVFGATGTGTSLNRCFWISTGSAGWPDASDLGKNAGLLLLRLDLDFDPSRTGVTNANPSSPCPGAATSSGDRPGGGELMRACGGREGEG